MPACGRHARLNRHDRWRIYGGDGLFSLLGDLNLAYDRFIGRRQAVFEFLRGRPAQFFLYELFIGIAAAHAKRPRYVQNVRFLKGAGLYSNLEEVQGLIPFPHQSDLAI